jgi:hypothetical protein
MNIQEIRRNGGPPQMMLCEGSELASKTLAYWRLSIEVYHPNPSRYMTVGNVLTNMREILTGLNPKAPLFTAMRRLQSQIVN